MFEYDDCKNIISRILVAYKLPTAKALADKWDISAGVLASRIKRNAFPADLVLKCFMDTGANVTWLANGTGKSGLEDNYKKPNAYLLNLQRYSLNDGKLNLFPSVEIDKSLLPDEIQEPEIIKVEKEHYVVDKKYKFINGKYFIDIEGVIGLYDLVRVPVNKVILNGGNLPKDFQMDADKINIIAKVSAIVSEV